MTVSSENDGSCGQTACDNSPCNRRTTDEDVAPAEGIGAHWIVGSVNTPAGDVPQVGTRLKVPDRLGTWKARWGAGRMRYGITAGLYAAGNPGDECPVLVTANYKMSFDRMRCFWSRMENHGSLIAMAAWSVGHVREIAPPRRFWCGLASAAPPPSFAAAPVVTVAVALT